MEEAVDHAKKIMTAGSFSTSRGEMMPSEERKTLIEYASFGESEMAKRAIQDYTRSDFPNIPSCNSDVRRPTSIDRVEFYQPMEEMTHTDHGPAEIDFHGAYFALGKSGRLIQIRGSNLIAMASNTENPSSLNLKPADMNVTKLSKNIAFITGIHVIRVTDFDYRSTLEDRGMKSSLVKIDKALSDASVRVALRGGIDLVFPIKPIKRKRDIQSNEENVTYEAMMGANLIGKSAPLPSLDFGDRTDSRERGKHTLEIDQDDDSSTASDVGFLKRIAAPSVRPVYVVQEGKEIDLPVASFSGSFKDKQQDLLGNSDQFPDNVFCNDEENKRKPIKSIIKDTNHSSAGFVDNVYNITPLPPRSYRDMESFKKACKEAADTTTADNMTEKRSFTYKMREQRGKQLSEFARGPGYAKAKAELKASKVFNYQNKSELYPPHFRGLGFTRKEPPLDPLRHLCQGYYTQGQPQRIDVCRYDELFCTIMENWDMARTDRFYTSYTRDQQRYMKLFLGELHRYYDTDSLDDHRVRFASSFQDYRGVMKGLGQGSEKMMESLRPVAQKILNTSYMMMEADGDRRARNCSLYVARLVKAATRDQLSRLQKNEKQVIQLISEELLRDSILSSCSSVGMAGSQNRGKFRSEEDLALDRSAISVLRGKDGTSVIGGKYDMIMVTSDYIVVSYGKENPDEKPYTMILDQATMMQHKKTLAGKVAAIVFASVELPAISETATVETLIDAWNCIEQDAIEYGTNAHAFFNDMEGFCQALMEEKIDSYCNLGLLDAIKKEARNSTKTYKIIDVDKMRTFKLMETQDISGMLSIASLSKHACSIELREPEGALDYIELSTTVQGDYDDEMEKMSGNFVKSVLKASFERHSYYPEVEVPDDPKYEGLRECIQNSKSLSSIEYVASIRNLNDHDWAKVKIWRLHKFYCSETFLTHMKPKTIAKGRGLIMKKAEEPEQVRESLTQSLVVYILGRAKCEQKAFYEKILTLGPDNWKNDPYIFDKLCCKYVEKAGELKKDPRFFGELTTEVRQLIADMNEVHKLILSHIAGNMMTKSNRSKSIVSHAMIDPRTDEYSETLGFVSLDINKWNSNFGSANTGKICEKIAEISDSEVMKWPHALIEKMLGFCQVAGELITWTEHLRGIEGQWQRLWTIITIIRIRSSLAAADVHHKVTASGDNCTVRVTVTKAEFESMSDERKKQRMLDVLNTLDEDFKKIGHTLKVSETLSSRDIYVLLKEYTVGKVQLSTGLKPVSRAAGDAAEKGDGYAKRTQGAFSATAGAGVHSAVPMALWLSACTVACMKMACCNMSEYLRWPISRTIPHMMIMSLNGSIGLVPPQRMCSKGFPGKLVHNLLLLRELHSWGGIWATGVESSLKVLIDKGDELWSFVVSPVSFPISHPVRSESVQYQTSREFLRKENKCTELLYAQIGTQRKVEDAFRRCIETAENVSILASHTLYETSLAGIAKSTVNAFAASKPVGEQAHRFFSRRKAGNILFHLEALNAVTLEYYWSVVRGNPNMDYLPKTVTMKHGEEYMSGISDGGTKRKTIERYEFVLCEGKDLYGCANDLATEIVRRVVRREVRHPIVPFSCCCCRICLSPESLPPNMQENYMSLRTREPPKRQLLASRKPHMCGMGPIKHLPGKTDGLAIVESNDELDLNVPLRQTLIHASLGITAKLEGGDLDKLCVDALRRILGHFYTFCLPMVTVLCHGSFNHRHNNARASEASRLNELMNVPSHTNVDFRPLRVYENEDNQRQFNFLATKDYLVSFKTYLTNVAINDTPGAVFFEPDLICGFGTDHVCVKKVEKLDMVITEDVQLPDDINYKDVQESLGLLLKDPVAISGIYTSDSNESPQMVVVNPMKPPARLGKYQDAVPAEIPKAVEPQFHNILIRLSAQGADSGLRRNVVHTENEIASGADPYLDEDHMGGFRGPVNRVNDHAVCCTLIIHAVFLCAFGPAIESFEEFVKNDHGVLKSSRSRGALGRLCHALKNACSPFSSPMIAKKLCDQLQEMELISSAVAPDKHLDTVQENIEKNTINFMLLAIASLRVWVSETLVFSTTLDNEQSVDFGLRRTKNIVTKLLKLEKSMIDSDGCLDRYSLMTVKCACDRCKTVMSCLVDKHSWHKILRNNLGNRSIDEGKWVSKGDIVCTLSSRRDQHIADVVAELTRQLDGNVRESPGMIIMIAGLSPSVQKKVLESSVRNLLYPAAQAIKKWKIISGTTIKSAPYPDAMAALPVFIDHLEEACLKAFTVRRLFVDSAGVREKSEGDQLRFGGVTRDIGSMKKTMHVWGNLMMERRSTLAAVKRMSGTPSTSTGPAPRLGGVGDEGDVLYVDKNRSGADGLYPVMRWHQWRWLDSAQVATRGTEGLTIIQRERYITNSVTVRLYLLRLLRCARVNQNTSAHMKLGLPHLTQRQGSTSISSEGKFSDLILYASEHGGDISDATDCVVIDLCSHLGGGGAFAIRLLKPTALISCNMTEEHGEQENYQVARLSEQACEAVGVKFIDTTNAVTGGNTAKPETFNSILCLAAGSAGRTAVLMSDGPLPIDHETGCTSQEGAKMFYTFIFLCALTLRDGGIGICKMCGVSTPQMISVILYLVRNFSFCEEVFTSTSYANSEERFLVLIKGPDAPDFSPTEARTMCNELLSDSRDRVEGIKATVAEGAVQMYCAKMQYVFKMKINLHRSSYEQICSCLERRIGSRALPVQAVFGVLSLRGGLADVFSASFPLTAQYCDACETLPTSAALLCMILLETGICLNAMRDLSSAHENTVARRKERPHDILLQPESDKQRKLNVNEVLNTVLVGIMVYSGLKFSKHVGDKTHMRNFLKARVFNVTTRLSPERMLSTLLWVMNDTKYPETASRMVSNRFPWPDLMENSLDAGPSSRLNHFRTQYFTVNLFPICAKAESIKNLLIYYQTNRELFLGREMYRRDADPMLSQSSMTHITHASHKKIADEVRRMLSRSAIDEDEHEEKASPDGNEYEEDGRPEKEEVWDGPEVERRRQDCDDKDVNSVFLYHERKLHGLLNHQQAKFQEMGTRRFSLSDNTLPTSSYYNGINEGDAVYILTSNRPKSSKRLVYDLERANKIRRNFAKAKPLDLSGKSMRPPILLFPHSESNRIFGLKENYATSCDDCSCKHKVSSAVTLFPTLTTCGDCPKKTFQKVRTKILGSFNESEWSRFSSTALASYKGVNTGLDGVCRSMFYHALSQTKNGSSSSRWQISAGVVGTEEINERMIQKLNNRPPRNIDGLRVEASVEGCGCETVTRASTEGTIQVTCHAIHSCSSILELSQQVIVEGIQPERDYSAMMKEACWRSNIRDQSLDLLSKKCGGMRVPFVSLLSAQDHGVFVEGDNHHICCSGNFHCSVQLSTDMIRIGERSGMKDSGDGVIIAFALRPEYARNLLIACNRLTTRFNVHLGLIVIVEQNAENKICRSCLEQVGWLEEPTEQGSETMPKKTGESVWEFCRSNKESRMLMCVFS